MRPALCNKFVEKAESALIAAIEVYNKPTFRYRAETFALLAINAWELLLKAKLIKDANNDPRVIRAYESRRTKAGTPSKKRYVKRNRSGSPLTISLLGCISMLDKQSTYRVAPEIKANIDALIAIRDNAAHYINASPVLAKQVLEIASASVKNFVVLAREWFGTDLSGDVSIMLPVGFLTGNKDVESVVITSGEERLLKYLRSIAAGDIAGDSPFAVAVRVHIRLERSKLATASKVQITNDPDAVRVILTEQNIKERYPWDYRELTRRCASRYLDFKQDGNFHAWRKPLLADARYAYSRFLDPSNPKSGRKDFYSPSILGVFDLHYAKK